MFTLYLNTKTKVSCVEISDIQGVDLYAKGHHKTYNKNAMDTWFAMKTNEERGRRFDDHLNNEKYQLGASVASLLTLTNNAPVSLTSYCEKLDVLFYKKMKNILSIFKSYGGIIVTSVGAYRPPFADTEDTSYYDKIVKSITPHQFRQWCLTGSFETPTMEITCSSLVLENHSNELPQELILYTNTTQISSDMQIIFDFESFLYAYGEDNFLNLIKKSVDSGILKNIVFHTQSLQEERLASLFKKFDYRVVQQTKPTNIIKFHVNDTKANRTIFKTETKNLNIHLWTI